MGMKKGEWIWRKVFWASVLWVGIAGLGTNALADDAFSKLGRGVSNTLSGWAEYLRQTELACKEQGQSVCLFTGAARGIYWSVIRTGAGVYEILTFPFKGPKNYGPILEPENVFSEIGNAKAPIT